MSSVVWGKFYWSDYASDEALKMCSLSAQGLWMRMLCTMAGSEPYGYLTINGHTLTKADLARLYAVSQAEVDDAVAELDRYGVFSLDAKGRIYSRRMVRDVKKAAISKKNGKRGGNPKLSKQRENSSWDNRQDKPHDKPHIPDARYQIPDKKGRLCTNKGSYPSDFEEFWKEYPTDQNMSKSKAFSEWKKLSSDDWFLAQTSVSAFRDYCRKDSTYRPVHASRFLSERRFDGFSAASPPTDLARDIALVNEIETSARLAREGNLNGNGTSERLVGSDQGRASA